MNIIEINREVNNKRRLYLEKYRSYSSFINKSPIREILKESYEKQVLIIKKNKYLYHEDEPAGGVYMVMAGKLKIISDENKSLHNILYLVKPGDILGIHALINGHNYTNSAVAIVTSEICFVPGNEFNELINKNSAYKISVMQLLCSRIDLIENQISNMSEKSVTERFAELLILLYETYGTNNKQNLKIKLNLDELAGLTGTSKVYFSRIISEFCSKRVINYEENSIKILKRNELENIAKI